MCSGVSHGCVGVQVWERVMETDRYWLVHGGDGVRLELVGVHTIAQKGKICRVGCIEWRR